MRFLLIMLASLLCGNAFAQMTAADVMTAYNEYNEALTEGDQQKALAAAKTAYERAEEVWGEAKKETALLAANYGDRLSYDKKYADAAPIYERCAAIIQALSEPSNASQLGYCEARLAQSYLALEDKRAEGAYRRAIAAFEAARESGAFVDEALLGESYLMVAQLSMPSGKRRIRSGFREFQSFANLYRETGELAAKAIPLLEKAYGEDSELVARAYMYKGYAEEAADDWESAGASYEKAATIFELARGSDDPITARAFGRWRFVVNYRNDEARKAQSKTARDGREPSSKECFFHEQGDLDVELCPIKRRAPAYPTTGYDLEFGGFTMLVYDVNEQGRTENVRVLESWPASEFERTSSKAVEGWVFVPPKHPDGSVVRAVGVQTMIHYELAGR